MADKQVKKTNKKIKKEWIAIIALGCAAIILLGCAIGIALSDSNGKGNSNNPTQSSMDNDGWTDNY